jgi:hypothetical protein
MSKEKPFEGEFGNLGSFVRGRGGDGVVHVTVIGPHYREEIGPEAMAAFEKLAAFTSPASFDELHPTGRCTCGGEGNCQWCQRVCPVCMGDCMDTLCDACDSTGWAFLEPQAPDYEALGYPETEFGEADLDYAAYVVGFASRGIAASVIAYQLHASEKDIRASTDNG